MLKINKQSKEKENLCRRIILFGAAVAMFALYFEKILWILGLIFNICMPFLLGGGLAFIFNIIANNIVRIYRSLTKKKENRIVRFLANIGSIAFVAALLAVFLIGIVPRAGASIQTIVQVMPRTLANIYHWAYYASKPVPFIHSWLKTLNADPGNISAMIENVTSWIVSGNVQDVVGSVYSVVTNTFSILFSVIIAVMFAIIVLFNKKTVVKEADLLMQAYLSKTHYKKSAHVIELIKNTFTSYISGSCTECLILGTLVAFFASVFGFPFAFLDGILVAIGALIPMFGALCAAILAALFTAIENPMQGVYFMIMFLCIQQVEGNFIYPHVMGRSVGLPPIYVMIAVTLGASLAGVLGMIIFIPILSCVHQLVSENAKARIMRKNKLEEEYEDS